MGDWQENTVVVGIVADPCNYAAEQFFEKQLSLSTSKCPNCKGYSIVPDALTHSVSSSANMAEISAKFNKGYHVVVAIVGVPDASGYKNDIHGLLNAWERSHEKPALLLVSNQPEKTRKIVESWHGWNSLPTELKNAIKVNDDYLIINGAKALDVIKERVETSKSLQQALTYASDTHIDPVVMRPAFSMSGQFAMPYVVK